MTYRAQRAESPMSGAAPGYPPWNRYWSTDQPKASCISANDQCGKWSTSKRPARLSVSPREISNGAEPSSTTFRASFERESSSHSRLTVSDQPWIFWISSNTSTAPARPDSFARTRAASHCCAIHAAPPPQGRLVGAREAHGKPRTFGDRLHQVGLSHLSWPRHGVDETARFGQAAGKRSGLRAGKGQGRVYFLLN